MKKGLLGKLSSAVEGARKGTHRVRTSPDYIEIVILLYVLSTKENRVIIYHLPMLNSMHPICTAGY